MNNLDSSPRLRREKKTLEATWQVYCESQHGVGALCEACQSALDYGLQRLRACPHGEAKPNCSSCPIHCYAKERRAEVRVMMRCVGPKMIWRHPLLSWGHLWDGWTRKGAKRFRK
jgi:hypothetical protein